MINDPIENPDSRRPRPMGHMRVLRGVSSAVHVGDILAPGAWREAEEEDYWGLRISLRLSLTLPCNSAGSVVQ